MADMVYCHLRPLEVVVGLTNDHRRILAVENLRDFLQAVTFCFGNRKYVIKKKMTRKQQYTM